MEREIIRRGKRIKPEIRIIRFFNAILDEAEPKTSPYLEYKGNKATVGPKLLGIYVVNRTLDEIVKSTGSTLASLYGRTDNNFHDVESIVQYYSDGNLGLTVDKIRLNSGSMILDYPVLHSVSNAVINGELLSNDVMKLNLSRYKLAID